MEGEATGVVGVVADELVCFVDHEHPTLCGFEHGMYHGFVVAPTGAYEGGTACHDDVPLAEGSCLVEQGCIDLAEGGLSCAGAAGNNQNSKLKRGENGLPLQRGKCHMVSRLKGPDPLLAFFPAAAGDGGIEFQKS